MLRRNKTSGKEGGMVGMERWLLSYADFITLLMIFFVMLYALSKVDIEKYNAIAESLSVVLTGNSLDTVEVKGPPLEPGMAGQQLGKNLEVASQLEGVKEQIEAFIKNNNVDNDNAAAGNKGPNIKMLDDYIGVISQERGLVVSIKDTLLFPSGSDELDPQARIIISQLGGVLLKMPNNLRIEGHTDDLPIHTAKFPSNWELSVMRATVVLHVLQGEAGIPAERLSATGYGETKPLVDNVDDKSRAVNRRVDIVILKQKYSDF